jgi:putative ABC transport system permease protein
MTDFWQDLRFGLRMLAKNPAFTAIAVLTLALGIGANTAIFSLINQILLRRLPVPNPTELVVLHAPGPVTGHVSDDGDYSESFSFLMYKNLRDSTSSLCTMLARYNFDASLADHGTTERGLGELVSGNYFEALGVQPAIGRMFSMDDDRVPGGHPLVVLSHSYWSRHFASDPAVLNKTLLVNNTEMTIVGVAGDGFTGVQIGKTPDVFVPLMMSAKMTQERSSLEGWNNYWMKVLARRKPGVSNEQLTAALNTYYRPLLEQQLPTITGWNDQKKQAFLNKKINLTPGARGRLIAQRDAGAPLTALFAMVALVLLIACTNVANLLLARGATRNREFAIRGALGATRGRMMRQLLVESLLCAFGGGLLGVLLGSWLASVLVNLVIDNAQITGLTPRLDPAVMIFAGAATVFSGMLFGILPAWRVTRSSVSDIIKDQGSTSSASVSHVRFRKVLVAGQVAFTMLLLAGATLFVRTLWNLRSINLGLRTENVISFSIAPALNGYDAPRGVALIDQIRAHVAAVPGVRTVASADIAALTGDDEGRNITPEGGIELAEELQDVNYVGVSPNYFSTLGVPLISGREFAESDGATSPKVAVASESMAKRFFPGRNAIGMHFKFGGGKSNKEPEIEIVGVVKDVKQDHVNSLTINPYVYIPYAQRPEFSSMTFYVHSGRDSQQLGPELQSQVRELDPNLPVYDVKTMQRLVEEDLFPARIVAVLSAGFASLAALLAALGIYGVLAYLVVQRTREIGIRMALGAEPGDVRWLVVKEVGSMVVAGVVIGLPLAYGMAHYSESLLYGVTAGSPLSYVLGLALIIVVALVACYLPARRATRVDPLVALRYQ